MTKYLCTASTWIWFFLEEWNLSDEENRNTSQFINHAVLDSHINYYNTALVTGCGGCERLHVSRPGRSEARCPAGWPAAWRRGDLGVPHGSQVGKENIGGRGGGGVAVVTGSTLAEFLATVRAWQLLHLALWQLHTERERESKPLLIIGWARKQIKII